MTTDISEHEKLRAAAEQAYVAGDLAQALQLCVAALQAQPAFDRAWYLQGVVQARSGNLDNAAQSLQQAVHIRPEFAEAQRALAAVEQGRGEFEAAANHYRIAISLGLRNAETLQELAAVNESLGLTEEAIAVRRELQREHPQLHANNFNLSALAGEEPPAHTPASMVRATFDGYAERFEQHLLDDLQYRGPQQLWDVLQRAGLSNVAVDVLDLGCGTGLCGERFKTLATRLTGVDISAAMLEKAEAKGIYDELHCQDVLEFVTSSVAGGQRYGLVLAGDVFVYIGDLAPLWRQVSQVLDGAGQFAFTIELGTQHDYALIHQRRYAHKADYIHRLCADAGFTVSAWQDCVVRHEQNADVPGAVVAVTKT